MKLQRFFVGSTCEENTTLCIPSLELVNQLKNVFRFAKGDQVVLFDNSGYDFISRIEEIGKESVSLTVLEKLDNTVRPERETYLFSSIVKKDNFEWIVEKATELGVSHIIPLISDRTEKKDVNKERLMKIIIEASEQSGRGTIPVLHEVTNLTECLQQYGHVNSIAWDPSAMKFSTKDIESVNGAYIGPEGGWSQSELEQIKTHGLPVRSLGPQILRAETAVVAVVSRLVF